MPGRFRTLFTMAAFLILGLAAQAQTQPSPEEGPYRVGGGVTRPEILSQGSKPQYTEAARKARISGVVILEAIIDEQGDVTNVRVLKGLPMGLDQAAVDAVQTWKFKPAMLEGKPVKVYYVLTVNFQVDGSPFQGPAILGFLRNHADYAELVKDRRFAEAAALLDRLPAGPEVGLARIYLLLDQDLFEEALRTARISKGPFMVEALQALASYARVRSQRPDLDPSLRGDILWWGFTAADLAREQEPDDPELMTLKSSLLRQRAAQMGDGSADAERLLAEADQLEAWAAEARARQAEERAGGNREEPLLVQGEVTRPEKISGDLPAGTEVARKARVWGNVIVAVVIDENGNVISTRIVQGLPMGLNGKALDAVRTWKFKPATLKGKPVKVRYQVTVNFPEQKLKGN
jgi:TonB family protein